jgi:hypothetical protein
MDIQSWLLKWKPINNCEYFIPPYELQNQTNGPDGLVFSQDIPEITGPHKSTWANNLGQLLSHSGVFPARTTLASLIQSTTNGYNALQVIINQSQPFFVVCVQACLDSPNFPYQKKGQSLVVNIEAKSL